MCPAKFPTCFVVNPSRSPIAKNASSASLGPGPTGASSVALESSRTLSIRNNVNKSFNRSSLRSSTSFFQSIVIQSLQSLSSRFNSLILPFLQKDEKRLNPFYNK